MGRALLLSALLFCVYGCSSSPSTSAPVVSEPGAVTNRPGGPPAKEEITEGPAESELPGLLDMPLYPGAKIASNKVATAGDEKRYRLVLETTDTVKKVGEFYKKNGITMEVRDAKGQFMGLTKKGNNVLMFAEEAPGKTVITIRVSPATH